MSSILVINAAGRETRVALVENGHIAEFYLERKKDKGIVGNIYKGRVVRVLPGMQAAFVDIGLEKAAFLYVGDVVYDPDFAKSQFELTEGEHDEEVPDIPEFEAAGEEHHEDLEVQEVPAGELAPPVGEPVRRVTGEIPMVVMPAAELAPLSVPSPSAPAAAATATAASPVSAPLPTPYATTGTTPPAPPTEAPATPASGAPTALEPMTAGLTPVSPPPPDVMTSPAPTTDAVSATIASEMPSPAPAAPSLATTAPQTAKDERGERRAPKDQGRRDKQDRGDKRPGRDRERGGADDKRSGPRDEDKKKEPRKLQKIEDLLKVGQEVVVQASKDPIGTKGARLTSHISIPGRHLVFMPTVDHIGISRRIGNEKERRRLREIVERLRPAGTGFIVRTVAENVPQEKLESDIRFLIEVWNEVVRANEKRRGPGLLHPDLDLILRATRDLFAHDVEKLVVDEREEYERIGRFVEAQDPTLKSRVVLHDNEEPVFDAYGIEQELKRATQRKVWLKSGGYLIMDQAEALTAIDVNSGRYVGKKSLEETITKINMEAAKEIVYQLRLRNIGGIIICDFIDMEKQQNRDKVFKSLQDALGRDKAKTNVLRISELGLVEMTRKRVRESIGRMLHEDCAYCEGRGYVKTITTVCYEIFREIRRESLSYKEPVLMINCHPEVARMLQGEERNELRHLMDRSNKSIQVKAQQNYHREQFDIYGRPATQADRAPGAPAQPGDSAEPDYSHSPPPPSNFRANQEARVERGGRGGGGRDDRGGRGGRDGGGRGRDGGGRDGGGRDGGGRDGGGRDGQRGGSGGSGGGRGGGPDRGGGQNRGGGGGGGQNRGPGSERGGSGAERHDRGGSGGGGPNPNRGGQGGDPSERASDRSGSGGGSSGHSAGSSAQAQNSSTPSSAPTGGAATGGTAGSQSSGHSAGNGNNGGGTGGAS